MRGLVVMTAVTLAVLGSVGLWQMRAGGEATPATPATTRTSNLRMVVREPAPLVPVSDAEMYHHWQAGGAATLRPVVDQGLVSDQEVFSQWQQRTTLAAGH
jgi:hypothetical protein